MSERSEEELVRRVVTLACGVILLTVPLLHFGMGLSWDWTSTVHLVVLGGACAALGRSTVGTTRIVLGAAGALCATTLTSVGMTQHALLSGTGDGIGLGTGLLWLAAGVAPAIFLVVPVRRALTGVVGAFATSLVVMVLLARSRLPEVVTHPGVWQLLVAVTVVLGATAAVAWLAGRSADERRLARVLRQERAARTARLEASQRRRALVFSRTAAELQAPMRDLTEATSSLRAQADDQTAELERIERTAGELLQRVVAHIEGLVERVRTEDGEAVPSDGQSVLRDDEADATTTVLMTFGVFAMVALDALRTVMLTADGLPDAHAAAAGANRMVAVLFLAAAVIAVRFPGRFGWWLSGLALLAHPIAVLLLTGPAGRAALLLPYAAAWRVAVLSAAMIALLARIMERRVRDRDALVAAASVEEVREAELRRREEAAGLAYAEAAHELKNPLSVIEGAARTLRVKGADLLPEQRNQLGTALVRAVARLDARLAVMREVAGDGDAEGELSGAAVVGAAPDRPAAAADVLLDALAAARMVLGDQPVDVDVRVTGDWTSASPQSVEHVLENLLSNAHKYGDGHLVRLTARREGSEIVVEVANHGGDLTRADTDRMFEPYWRAANADERADGTGIGLAVVARLVRQWGGRCWARVGGGWIRVGFTMPVTESVRTPTWQELQDQLG